MWGGGTALLPLVLKENAYMPFYDFKCPVCGTFEQRASFDTEVVPCECGRGSSRQSVYKINHKIAGRSLPSQDDGWSVQDELGKDMRKKGWNYDRAMTELRKNRTYDKEGNMSIDTTKIAPA